MPIGKNSLKRVTNNGYSNVKTEAPDMENSTVTVEKPAQTEAPKAKKSSVTKKTAQTTKAEPKKAEAPKSEPKKETAKKAPAKKSAPKKSMESEPDFSPVKTAQKVIEKPATEQKRQGDGYVNLGGELPYYLL